MNLPSFDFTNWREHPSDNRYTIFFFKTQNESSYFEKLLQSHNIGFEYNFEEEEPNYKYFYAVNKLKTKEVIKLNHLTIGEYRKPFIANTFLRYSLVIMMFIIMIIAITGYIKSL
jgi:hypothetical protein